VKKANTKKKKDKQKITDFYKYVGYYKLYKNGV